MIYFLTRIGPATPSQVSQMLDSARSKLEQPITDRIFPRAGMNKINHNRGTDDTQQKVVPQDFQHTEFGLGSASSHVLLLSFS